MPVDSPYPKIEIPSVGIWDHFFERKDRPFGDDKGEYGHGIGTSGEKTAD